MKIKYALLASALLTIAINVTAQKASPKKQATIQYADSLFALSDYRNAIPVYEAVLKETPSIPLGWNRLGQAYHALQEYANALKCYNNALQHNAPAPMLPVLYSRLSRIYALIGDKNKAFEYLEKAITNGYGNVIELNDNTDYKNLREDARFAKIITDATAIAFPCTTNPKAREFDFWVGEWDVYATRNPSQKVGFNKITIQPGGCSLLESWEASGYPQVGQSMNFYNPNTDRWEQRWVGSAGNGSNISHYYDGVFKDNAMQFKWDATVMGNPNAIGRFTFTNLSPGRVTQHLELSNDEGKTWQTVYNFTYIRREPKLDNK